MSRLKLFYALACLVFLAGTTGCRTTGDNPDVYWGTHSNGRPALYTPFGDYETSH